jgi:hypothetical protein
MTCLRRWLSLLLIVVLAGAPVASYAAKAKRGSLLLDICSSTSVKAPLPLDLNGPAPANSTAGHDQHDCCGGCAPVALATIASPAPWFTLHLTPLVVRLLPNAIHPLARVQLSDAAPRAPPSLN